MGDGIRVYFWHDCYYGDDTFKSRHLELLMIAGNKDATVVDFIDVSNGTVYWVLFFPTRSSLLGIRIC